MSADFSALKTAVFGDLERELKVTRSVLAAVPDEHHSWKPHEKSMPLIRLALHVAYLPDWIRASLAADELDAASAPRPPADVKDASELLQHFDRNANQLRQTVERFDMANWNNSWTMRSGGQVMVTQPRPFVYRIWCVNHMIHHRGQVALYLRLLSVPVPTIYFNTADNPAFVFE